MSAVTIPLEVVGGEQVVRLFHPDGRCLGVRSTRTEEATDEARAEAAKFIVVL
jgi:hypothetical protein